jgi:RNA polymerase sigma-70 factor (ECF subfamily)
VPIARQNAAQWDGAMIDEAESLLQRAWNAGRVGRYQLEAALQSAHNVRRTGVEVPWRAILHIYDGLVELTGSPVTALNRAVASAEVHGPENALRELDSLASDARLRDYQPYWAARAELLARTGAMQEALSAYDRAIGLERDPAVRRFLQKRAADIKTRRSGG